MIVLRVFFVSDADAVASSKRTTVARIFSRGRPGLARSVSMRLRIAGRTAQKAMRRPNFHAIPDLAVTGVIAILLATFRVAADRLKMPVGIRTDPDESPRWRNGHGPDAIQYLFVSNRLAVGSDIGETFPRTLSNNARPRIGNITQSGDGGGFNGIDGFGSGESA
jgi:hypothetical protein